MDTDSQHDSESEFSENYQPPANSSDSRDQYGEPVTLRWVWTCFLYHVRNVYRPNLGNLANISKQIEDCSCVNHCAEQSCMCVWLLTERYDSER